MCLRRRDLPPPGAFDVLWKRKVASDKPIRLTHPASAALRKSHRLAHRARLAIHDAHWLAATAQEQVQEHRRPLGLALGRLLLQRAVHTTHAGHLLVLALQLARLDWDDPRVWEEQLTGVDFAYFREIIQRIRKLLAEDAGMQEIIATYLAQIVEETI
jgi:hypothetical protein